MKKKLDKIWFFSDFAHREGGASIVVIENLIQLKKKGMNVSLISNYGPIDKDLIENRIPVFCLYEKRVFFNFSFLLNISLFKFLFNNKNLFGHNDKFHIHSWTKGLSLTLFFFFYKYKRKIIITLHDYFTFCPNGAYFNFNKNYICNLRPLSLQCFFSSCDSRSYIIKLYRFIYLLIFKYFYKKHENFTKLIFISNFQQKIINQFRVTKHNYVINNPITFHYNFFATKKINQSNYIYIGRLSKEKGVLDIAHAAKLLSLNIIFIGDGPMKNKIKKIYNRAVITGWIDHAIVLDYLKNARMGFFSSRWYEPFGLTAFEMMGNGIPLIVAKNTYISSLLLDKVNCIKYDPYNKDEIINAIKISFDNKLINKLSSNCYKFQKKYYQNVSCVNDLKKIYLLNE